MYASNMLVWYFLVYLGLFVFFVVLNEGSKCCVHLPIISLLVFSHFHFWKHIMHWGLFEEMLPAE